MNSVENRGFFKISSTSAIFVLLQVFVFAICFTPLIMSHTVGGVNLCGWVIGIFPIIVSFISLIQAFITKGENR